jgi:trehalose 6-phosphate synthase/phosphatase
MNLVAKEFVASRTDEDGVLVLSEFAGAAAELNGAMTVNPYDVEGVARVLHRALHTSPDERRARMRDLRRQVLTHDVHVWTRSFLSRLAELRPTGTPEPATPPAPTLQMAIDTARRTQPLRLLLDYDGTLVPMTRSPELAAPDEDLLELLDGLATSPGVALDIVSGRPRDTLEQWFGHLPIALWAEHGFWFRAPRGDAWSAAMQVPSDWLARIAPILEQFVDSTPGAHLEVKTASLAWHYRNAQRDFGTRQAHELRMLLGDLLSNQPFEVLEGKKVIEVRLRGVNKGVVGHRVVAEAGPATAIIAVGDDRTDEDLFRALPDSSITVAVGRRWTSARFCLEDYRAVRQMLSPVTVSRRRGTRPGCSGAATDAPGRRACVGATSSTR